jgi:hypothetical protein
MPGCLRGGKPINKDLPATARPRQRGLACGRGCSLLADGARDARQLCYGWRDRDDDEMAANA